MITAEEARKQTKLKKPGYTAGLVTHLLLNIEEFIIERTNKGLEEGSYDFLVDYPLEVLDKIQDELKKLGYEANFEFQPGTQNKVFYISWKEKKSELAKPRKKTSR